MGYSLILTFDPNFQRGIQGVGITVFVQQPWSNQQLRLQQKNRMQIYGLLTRQSAGFLCDF